MAEEEFSPLGGMHDGGADGVIMDAIYEGKPAGHFYQASTQANYAAKIRSTIRDLRKAGRTPSQLTYATSARVSKLDIVEDDLSAELDTSVRIRDREIVASRINASAATRLAYDQYLASTLLPLLQVTRQGAFAKRSDSLSVYAFLRLEMDDGPNLSLTDAVTDSLILWALEGTDPDERLLLTPAEVLSGILQELPWAEAVVQPRLNDPLLAMSAKQRPEGRQVDRYAQENHYCLPYATRRHLNDEPIGDVVLRQEVLTGLAARVARVSPSANAPALSEICLDAIGLAFQQQGVEVADLLARKDDQADPPTVVDAIKDALHASGTTKGKVEATQILAQVVSGVFYGSQVHERQYLRRLSQSYALMFALRQEPRIVQFLDEMNANQRLAVGTDLLVRAMSERFLADEDKQTSPTVGRGGRSRTSPGGTGLR